ncbi:MAG: helix-turn-helix transcriptional regulator [Clostridia bacterium]|nr:helix-turn-helix transcriptional regulator [Clostridia bacterium]
MDKKSMGTFLTELRKEKGLTQQEVADNLNVSNKTISKWERDEGYPEITMLTEIAKYYGITTDELLSGERFVRETEICDSGKDNFSEISKTVSIASATISAFSFLVYFIFCFFSEFSGFLGIVYGMVGCTIISLICFILNKIFYNIMKKEKKEITSNNINLLCFSGLFSYTNTLSCGLLFISEKSGFLLARCDSYIPFALLISIVIIYKMRLRLLKANNLYSVSKENEKLKKKLSVISKSLIIVAFLCAVIFALVEANNSILYADFDKIEEFVFYLKIAVMGVSIGSIGLIGFMTWIYNKKKI